MTTKPVLLFGRRMRVDGQHLRYFIELQQYGIHPSYADNDGTPHWFGAGPGISTKRMKDRHAVARALERKIVAAHRRLGKLIGGGK